MLRSATTIRPSLAKSSAMKKRRRRSSYCATKTCATKLADCSTCLTTVSERLFFRASGSTAGSQRRSKKWEEIRRYARADSATAEYCAFEIAPRAEQKRAAGGCRAVGRSLTRSWEINLRADGNVRAFFYAVAFCSAGDRLLRGSSKVWHSLGEIRDHSTPKTRLLG